MDRSGKRQERNEDLVRYSSSTCRQLPRFTVSEGLEGLGLETEVGDGVRRRYLVGDLEDEVEVTRDGRYGVKGDGVPTTGLGVHRGPSKTVCGTSVRTTGGKGGREEVGGLSRGPRRRLGTVYTGQEGWESGNGSGVRT